MNADEIYNARVVDDRLITSGQPTEDPRLGVVRMHDVGAQLAEHRDHLADREDVGHRIVGTREVGERFMLDPPRLELGHVRPGCRAGDHLVTELGERPELRTQEQHKADVGGRHVHQSSASHQAPR